MDIATTTASIAGICMAVCQIPQAWKVYKTQKTENISALMQAILSLGSTMWMVTGILLDSLPMIVSNAICLVFCLYILYKCLSKAKH